MLIASYPEILSLTTYFFVTLREKEILFKNRQLSLSVFELAIHNPDSMQHAHPGIHASEYMWASVTPDYMILNDGSMDDLKFTVKDLLQDLLVSTQ